MEIYSFSEYQSRLKNILTLHGFNILEISNHSYIASINRMSSQRLALMSGLHGDEKSGPLAILSWLEELPIHFFRRQKNGLWIAPLINNVGWEQSQRDWMDLDLNRSFHQDAPFFLKELMCDIDNYSPTIFLDLHEDSSVNYAYLYQLVGKKNKIGSKLIEILNIDSTVRTETWTNDDPQWFGASEVMVLKNGCENSFTLETPEDWPLLDRISLYKKAISWCFVR